MMPLTVPPADLPLVLAAQTFPQIQVSFPKELWLVSRRSSGSLSSSSYPPSPHFSRNRNRTHKQLTVSFCHRQQETSSDSSVSPSPPTLPPRSFKMPSGAKPARHLAPTFTPPLMLSRATAGTDPGQIKPAIVLTLREVAGAEGLIKVHMPFALSELSHVSKLLGSYTADPTNFIKEFQYLTQSYNLTYQDVYVILFNNLLPEERRRVWEQARQYADEVHQTLASHPPGAEAVDQEPHWDYNSPSGILARDQLLTCLTVGLHKAALKPVNYSKLAEIFQDTKENPSAFLDRLTKAMLQFTNMDPESTEGRQLLMSHFINQSYSDIRGKLRRLEKGSLTPQAQLLEMAFKIYHARNDKAKNHCHVITAPARPAEVTDFTACPVRAAPPPPGPCFKCAEKEGYALGVLGHQLGPSFAPVAYLSKKMDLTTQGWAPCIRALAAAKLLIRESKKTNLRSIHYGFLSS
ncbi:uncharacterized protein [Alexandromys fortis]|uniref:uncharacterized protein n=1 Tax=Alexandromys fortis TaxID=100897 RepID=UPI0021533411|nr:uncharacterized protein LOC126488066 [Microtus fortis]